MYLTKMASVQLVNWKILEQYGQDPAEVFSRAGLDSELMYDPKARYPLEMVARLWVEMSRCIKDPCFGLQAAKHWHPANFGALGYALLMSSSLRSILERLFRFHKIIADGWYGRLSDDVERKVLTCSLFSTQDFSYYIPAREDSALAWILSVLRVNFQKPLSPVSVTLTHDEPECSWKYFEFFACPVEFKAASSSLEFRLEDVDRYLPHGNEEILRFHDQTMAKYLLDTNQDLLQDRVRRSIVEHLPSGKASIEQTAVDLGMGARSLQRQLKQLGTSFVTVLQDVREKIAMEYMRNKDMDLAEIAFLLGYSEQSAFSRSFKQWTGKTPREYRKIM